MIDKEIEIWKQYKDTQYYFSSFGREKRICKNGKEKIISGFKNKSRCKDSTLTLHPLTRKHVSMAKMVYETFYGDIEDGYYVTHKDKNFWNDDIHNLILVSKVDLGKISGKIQKNTLYIKDLTNGKIYKGIRECARELFVSRNTVSNCLKGKKTCINHKLKVIKRF